MKYSFKLCKADGTSGEEFIKLGERYSAGFRLESGEHLLVVNNVTNEKSSIGNNASLGKFIKDYYYDGWDPLAEHKELKDPLFYPAGKVSQIPAGAEINATKIADIPVTSALKLDKDFDKAVNPAHYKNYFQNYQFLEVMQDVLPDVDSAVLYLTLKYLARSGKKDDRRQEALKALWHLKFYTARLIAGRNIKISEVDEILAAAK
jgi:hypothetical protein